MPIAHLRTFPAVWTAALPAALALLPALALAQTAPMAPAPACPAPVAPTGALAPWSAPVALQAGADGDHATPLAPGRAAQIALLPTPQVHYPLPPARPGSPASHGGVLRLDVASAGTYRIALDAAAWLDVVGADGPQHSTAHGHGPDCSGIRKMVDFTLKPGRYSVQISASDPAQVRVLVAVLP